MLRALRPDVKRKSDAAALFVVCAFPDELSQASKNTITNAADKDDDLF